MLSISSTISTIVPADFNFDAPLAPTAPPPETARVAAPEMEAAASGISPLVWLAIGGAAVFVVTGATYVLWPSGSQPADKPTPVVAAPEHPTPSTPTVAESNTGAKPEPAAPVESTSKKSEPPIINQPEQQAEAAKDTSPIATTKLEAAHAESRPPAATPPVPPPTAVAAATPPTTIDRPDEAPKTAHANPSTHVLKFDPLDFDPEHLSLSSTPTATTTSTSSIPAAASSEAPAAEAQSQKAPEASDLLPPPAPNQNQNVRRGPAAADDSQPLDTAQHLAMKVKTLEFTDMPLGRFIDTISQISGAAITLDPIALELNGQSPRTPVSLKVEDTTLDKALQDTLAAQRLELSEADSHVTVGLAGADDRHAADFDVKDLVSDGNAAPIAKLIEQFVAPHSWKTNGGKGAIEVQGGSLHIDQTLAVRREVLIFCERLRLARSRPLRSKYPADLLTVASPSKLLAPLLAKPTTFTFLPWTRLADVFAQWQQLSRVTILVDWSALSDVNLRPSSPIACSTIGKSWTEAFESVLEPLGLTWWAVDGQTIQITSFDALDRIERVEFYAVPQKMRSEVASDDVLIEALQKQIEARPNKRGRSSDVRLQIDEPSNHLIVRATPDVQRYLTVATL